MNATENMVVVDDGREETADGVWQGSAPDYEPDFRVETVNGDYNMETDIIMASSSKDYSAKALLEILTKAAHTDLPARGNTAQVVFYDTYVFPLSNLVMGYDRAEARDSQMYGVVNEVLLRVEATRLGNVASVEELRSYLDSILA